MPTVPPNNTIPCFDRLLVADDFWGNPAPAIDTCLALRASLLILHVFHPVEAGSPDGGEEEAVGREDGGGWTGGARGRCAEAKLLYDKCLESLEELRLPGAKAGVDCETILGSGNPDTF